MSTALDTALALVRAGVYARHEGRHTDARAIDRALTALLSLDDDEDDGAPTVGPPSRGAASGTRIGLGGAAM